MDDESIISLYWQRSESAISESETKYGAYCRSIALNLLRVQEDAEECVSDTWLSAWNSMPPQRPSRLRLFLGRITRNGAIDRLRAKGRKKRGEGSRTLPLDELEECIPAQRGPETVLEEKEIAGVISRWLRSLTHEKCTVFVRRYWYFESVEDISARFGFSRAKVTSMLYRLRADLRETLEKEGITL